MFAITSVEIVRVPQIAVFDYIDLVAVLSVFVDHIICCYNHRVFIVHSWGDLRYDYFNLWVSLSQLRDKSSYVIEHGGGIFRI